MDQRRRAAAEHGLFAEEVGFRFFLERGLDDPGAGAADTLGPREGNFLRLLARILEDGDQRGHALSLDILAAHDVAGAFRRDHDHVHLRRRHDGLEMDGEPVAEQQRLALGEMRGHVFLVHVGNLEIRHGEEDHVGFLHGLGGVGNRESLLGGHGARRTAGIQADDHVHAAVLEVERVGMSLGTKPDDRASLGGEDFEVGVFVGVNFGGHGRRGGCGLVVTD